MVADRKSLDIDAVANADGLTAVAERLAAECLAPRAAHYDDTATHPVDSWRDVWRQGMLAMGIPRRFGGLELDMLTYVKVVERLAGGCTNTGMTVHMHSTVTRFIDALAGPEGVQASVEKQTMISVKGIDKRLVTQTAANIRRVRPPDVYKQKGIRYAGEILIKKAGKAGKK